MFIQIAKLRIIVSNLVLVSWWFHTNFSFSTATPLLPPPPGHGRQNSSNALKNNANNSTPTNNGPNAVIPSSGHNNTGTAGGVGIDAPSGANDVMVCSRSLAGGGVVNRNNVSTTQAAVSRTDHLQEEMPDDGDCSDTDMEIKSLDLTGELTVFGAC